MGVGWTSPRLAGTSRRHQGRERSAAGASSRFCRRGEGGDDLVGGFGDGDADHGGGVE